MCKSLKLLSFLGGVDKLPLFGIIRYMRKEIDNNNKREVDMTMTFNENLGFQFEKFISDEIVLNGIKGVQAILDMIKDTIDNGDTEDAKMWISELQNELLNNNVRG
jgi:hypothetical protein